MKNNTNEQNIYFDNKNQRYRIIMTIEGKQIYLGSRKLLPDAISYRDDCLQLLNEKKMNYGQMKRVVDYAKIINSIYEEKNNDTDLQNN